MGVSQIRGTFLEVLIIRTIDYRIGVCIRVPLFWETTISINHNNEHQMQSYSIPILGNQETLSRLPSV